MAALGCMVGQDTARGRKSVNTGEYALQMCRPVTLQVNTRADGQLGTGWPHRRPPREQAGRGGGRCTGGRGGPDPGARHPEDLCSLAGRTRRTGNEREQERQRKKQREGEKSPWERSLKRTGADCSPPVPPHVASKGAPAASANFRLAQTCELLGAN